MLKLRGNDGIGLRAHLIQEQKVGKEEKNILNVDSEDVRDLRLVRIVFARSRFVPEQSKFLLAER